MAYDSEVLEQFVFEPANFDDTDIAVCSKDYGDFTKWPKMTITYQW
jgi:hypothetical protein